MSKLSQTEQLPFSLQHKLTRVAPVKATKHKANPATDEVRMDNQTMVLPDHTVAITEQSQDCKANSKIITKGGTKLSSPKTHVIFKKTLAGVKKSLLKEQSRLSQNAFLHGYRSNPFFEIWICKSLSVRI